MDKRHIKLMQKIVEEQSVVFPRITKALTDLSVAGYVFIHESDNAVFGNKEITVRPSLDGEDWLEEQEP